MRCIEVYANKSIAVIRDVLLVKSGAQRATRNGHPSAGAMQQLHDDLCRATGGLPIT